MTHTNMLGQQQLATFLDKLVMQQKTGKILVYYSNAQPVIYIHQGSFVAITFPNARVPLVKRLVLAGTVSPHDLQKVPAHIGRKLTAIRAEEQLSDIESAKILLDLKLISHEQLMAWTIQDIKESLYQLLTLPNGEIYFEEGALPPEDCLNVLSQTLQPNSFRETKNLQLVEGKNGQSELFTSSKNPATPSVPSNRYSSTSASQNWQLRQTPPTHNKFAPVTPSGFVKIAKTDGIAQEVVTPKLTQHHVSTEKVAIPKKSNFLRNWEIVIIIVVLLIAGLAHGINMFHFPYYEDDEGTYLSQAWAVLNLGKLAYYTYWYDHAPGGWILLSLWGAITGGFYTFGSAMNSGRIFMLVLQLGSTFILYRIAKTISGSITVAIIACLFFALSPYGLYYHRRILLDNIMTFWMLLSILFLLKPRLSLKYVWLSAVALAVSVLSKEVTVFIIPAAAFIVWIRSSKLQRRIAIVGWFTIVFSILSLYILLAALKGELFPTGTLLGGTNPHASLLGSILYQGSRLHDGGIFNPNSATDSKLRMWAIDDPTLVIIGSFCAISSVVFIKKNILIGCMGIITLSLWLFLIRGGEVLDFYLIPLIPMLALHVSLTLGQFGKYLQRTLRPIIRWKSTFSTVVQVLVVIACLGSILVTIPLSHSGIGFGASNIGDKNNPLIDWNSTQADAQLEAIAWVENKLPRNTRIVADMYMWPDLYHDGYVNTHYYWKVYSDPAIGNKIFHNDWRNIDYIITTPQMFVDINTNGMGIIKDAIDHSTSVATYNNGGWQVDIREVHK